MDMNRSQFLEMWQSYPPMPDGCQVWGRVSVIEAEALEISRKGRWKLGCSVCIGPCQKGWVEVPVTALREILRNHDQIAIEISDDGIQKVHLLAPALAKTLSTDSRPEVLAQWAAFLAKVRHFFSNKNFLEVQTPTLVTCPGTEPFLDVFSTEFRYGSQKKKFYLPTSPELHLKKMLSMGYEQVFEMRPCFRNGELTERHLPEFWMLEWYRSYSNLEQIQHDTLHLIQFLSGQDFPLKKISIAELFQKHLGFELQPNTSQAQLLKLAKDQGLIARTDWTWDEVFHLLFVEKVEPFIDSKDPVFVEKYPPSQAALARLTDDGWGDRFELYWKGFELANAFHELNDPEIQMHRLNEDLKLKEKIGKESVPLDKEFLDALKSGMPPSGGIAMGLERLFMCLHEISEIQSLKVFATFE